MPLAILAHYAAADSFPLWEAGAGVSLIQFPDYRGSDERQLYALPIPYFVYRGDFLKVDRQKIRGLFFTRDWAELDFSLSGSVPVKSSKNDARRGMEREHERRQALGRDGAQRLGRKRRRVAGEI